MSRPLPVEEPTEQVEEQEEPQERDKPRLTLVEPAQEGAQSVAPPWGDYMGEIDTLRVPYDSLGAAAFERGSLLRLFRKEFSNYVHFLMSERGGSMSMEEACRSAAIKHDEAEAARLMEELLKTPMESVAFSQLSDLWCCSREEAEKYWNLAKNEAQREFLSGHMAAEAFEPVDWLRSVWQRARFLAVRDTFLLEYQPEGGIEYALVDTLAQAFFMQQYWSEVAVKRTKTTPYRESNEFNEWKGYKREEAKSRRFEHGWWDIPYVYESAAVEQSTRMVDTFSKLFQRTLRQLNGHRLAKLKARKLRAEIRRLEGKGVGAEAMSGGVQE